MFSLSVAMDLHKGIGYKNVLPWHISEELKLFKKNTLGKNIVMGRKTYEYLPGKLENRIIHVVSKDSCFKSDESLTVNDVDDFIKLHQNEETEYVICGGASIYKKFYPFCQKVYLSVVDGEYETDVKFDEFNIDDFEVIEKNRFEKFTYYLLERK